MKYNAYCVRVYFSVEIKRKVDSVHCTLVNIARITVHQSYTEMCTCLLYSETLITDVMTLIVEWIYNIPHVHVCHSCVCVGGLVVCWVMYKM